MNLNAIDIIRLYNVTSDVYDDSTGRIFISRVTGDVVITAS